MSGHLGGGVIATGVAHRDDQLGLAVAHAILSPAACAGLPGAETSVELTHQRRIGRLVAVQSDAQWIRHPAGVAGARDALLLGLRLVLNAGYPEESPSPSSADPHRIAGRAAAGDA